jgi:xanthine phosphoribosyltransferase
MTSTQRYIVSWDEFHADCRALAQLLAQKGPWRATVGVARGGLVPAALLARELDIRVVEVIAAASYEGEERGALKLLKDLSPTFVLEHGEGEGVLLVDDLVDTGATAALVRSLLPRAHVATVYAKPQGRAMSDTFVREFEQSCWVDFPWDLE